MFLICSHDRDYISRMSVSLRKSQEFDSFPLEAGGIAAGRRHGRGAQTNRSGRFEPIAYEPTDDGWESLAELEALSTEVQEVPARRIITRNESPDIGFDRSINPVSGLRAWLHLLLRAPDPRLSRALAGARLRDKAVRQDQCRAGAGARACRAGLSASGPSPSAPIPTPISRSSGATASCAASWKS